MDQSKSTLKWFKGDTKIEKTINLRFQNKQKCTQKATYQGRMLKILISKISSQQKHTQSCINRHHNKQQQWSRKNPWKNNNTKTKQKTKRPLNFINCPNHNQKHP